MLISPLREWLNEAPQSVIVPVSSQDIAKFAIATGATDTAHFSADVSRERGYPDVMAPDLFYLSLRTSSFNVVPQRQLHEEGTSLADIPPIEYETAMAGETEVTLHRPFVAGEPVRVTCTREKATMKQGRSGVLTLIEFRYEYTTASGGPIVTEHFIRIFR